MPSGDVDGILEEIQTQTVILWWASEQIYQDRVELQIPMNKKESVPEFLVCQHRIIIVNIMVSQAVSQEGTVEELEVQGYMFISTTNDRVVTETVDDDDFDWNR